MFGAYYGATTNGDAGETKVQPYDMHCPDCGGPESRLNFWKAKCLNRIGKKDMGKCTKGCGYARSHPELKVEIERILQVIINRDEALNQKQLEDRMFMRRKQGNGVVQQKNRKFTRAHRKFIIDYKEKGKSISQTAYKMNCSRATVTFYRKMYKDGHMDMYGRLVD